VPLNEPFKCQAQIRYNSAARSAIASINTDGGLQIDFDEPCDAIAPGQAVVCFDGDVVLGGGWIL
jgi:tRNA-specific 2-thiouridylase